MYLLLNKHTWASRLLSQETNFKETLHTLTRAHKD